MSEIYPIHSLYCMLVKRRRRGRNVCSIVEMGYIPLYKCMEYILYNVDIFDMICDLYYEGIVKCGYTCMKELCKKYNTRIYIDMKSISGIGVKACEPFECFKFVFSHYISPINKQDFCIVIAKTIEYHHNNFLEFIFPKFADCIRNFENSQHLTNMYVPIIENFKLFAIRHNNFDAIKILDQ